MGVREDTGACEVGTSRSLESWQGCLSSDLIRVTRMEWRKMG